MVSHHWRRRTYTPMNTRLIYLMGEFGTNAMRGKKVRQWLKLIKIKLQQLGSHRKQLHSHNCEPFWWKILLGVWAAKTRRRARFIAVVNLHLIGRDRVFVCAFLPFECDFDHFGLIIKSPIYITITTFAISVCWLMYTLMLFKTNYALKIFIFAIGSIVKRNT